MTAKIQAKRLTKHIYLMFHTFALIISKCIVDIVTDIDTNKPNPHVPLHVSAMSSRLRHHFLLISVISTTVFDRGL